MNPFTDTRIYVGDPELDVTTILGGIDMNSAEVLLADRLREKGTPIDAIYTHHPEGWGLIKLDAVMEVQADIWAGFGVPIQAGEKFISERMDEIKRRFMPMNYDQAVDVARLLDIPFFSAHTPTDNLVVQVPERLTSRSASPSSSRTSRRACWRSPSTASPRRRAPAPTSARAARRRAPARSGST